MKNCQHFPFKINVIIAITNIITNIDIYITVNAYNFSHICHTQYKTSKQVLDL